MLGLHDEERTIVDTHDPTDGIGSISFTKEEESGFFGSMPFFQKSESACD
jgi:hypothetical protein